jgi:two-component system OmpR family sensor kinase/two-component system sensor histidine kinase BaeS
MRESTRTIRNRLFLLLLRALGIVLLLYVLLLLATTGLVLTYPSQQNPLRRIAAVGRLETFYIARGSWEGVHMAFGPHGGPDFETAQWQRSVLLDANNRVVVDHGQPVVAGRVVTAPNAGSAIIPIMVNGQEVGTLLVDANAPPPERQLAFGFLRPMLAVAILLGVFALVAGWLLTRRVVTPLAEVISAAEAVADGDLSARVNARGPQDLRALSDSFNQMADALERNDRERRAMLADIAHELRTPLSVLRGRLEGVMDGIYPADQGHIVPALEEAYLLERLVDDLRLLTVAEAGQLTFERTDLDLNDLAGKVIGLFQAQADESGVEISLQSELPQANALLDPQRTEQVIGNLVANALRYTPSGGRIWIDVRRQGDAVALSVNDTGPGIPEEQLPLIFDRFWRGDKSRARTSGGAGLGLAIARQLIEGQGGAISARNLPQGGLSIEIRIPA